VQSIAPQSIVFWLLLGLGLGVITGLAQVLIEERLYRRVPLRTLLIARILVAVVFLAMVNVVAYLTVADPHGVSGLLQFAVAPGNAAVSFYLLWVDAFLLCLRKVNLLLGEGNLWGLLSGEFYTPREEERIFMFLDLRSSTSLAETLGHVEYSELIQDCFNDLGVVAEYEARICQYVGDGVVLTWGLQDGLRDRNCLAAYFRFKEMLASRRSYYVTRYRGEPVFAAGVNVGVVTVTEVGRFKREIAYHGDSVNTAARIQGQCKVLGHDLLISDALVQKFPAGDPSFVPLGSIPLRGKDETVRIYSVPGDSRHDVGAAHGKAS